MVTDYELYKLTETELQGYSIPESAKMLAQRFGLSTDSVRSRIYRAKTPSNRTKLSTELLSIPEISPSILRQENIIKESNREWDAINQKWSESSRNLVGYFISDRHLGAKLRQDYWNMTLQILEDEPHVDVWSGLNDWQDNEGWGRHDDTRRPSDKLLSEDVTVLHNAESFEYRTIKDITGAKGVGLLGNHDAWYFKKVRGSTRFDGEKLTADRMTELYDSGLLLFNRMNHENHVELGEHLVWVHGVRSSAKRATSRARAHLSQYMTDWGQTRSVCVGHSHRPILLRGSEVDYKNAWFANAGTYIDHRSVSYAPDNQGVGWKGAIIRCEFHPQSKRADIALIEFRDEGAYAVASKNGTEICRVLKD